MLEDAVRDLMRVELTFLGDACSESFAIALSYALTPRTLQTNSAQFTTLILIQVRSV